jgi:nucleoside-diphosphate-sugar epimerase
VRLWLSGGTGFLGGALARKLRERDHHVVALARTTANVEGLRALGCEIAIGDVTDRDSIVASMRDCEGGFHVAAWYEIGVTDREAMFAVNVGGTRNVVEAMRETKLPKLVYCSSVAALGPHATGTLPGEALPTDEGSPSPYNASKAEAHRVVRAAVAEGLPIVTVIPGGIVGPGDPSMLAKMIDFLDRGLLRVSALDDGEFSFAHVDDVAEGHVLAFEKGRPGEEYVLGGEVATIRQAIHRAAVLCGRKPPKRSVPTPMLKAMVPLSRPFVRALRLGGPNLLRESIDLADGSSYAYSSEKAERELGYAPRGFDETLKETIDWLRERRAAKKRRA